MLHHLVETTCHANQALAFWAEKLDIVTVVLTIYSNIMIRIIFEKVWSNDTTHQPINSSKV